MEDQTTTEAQNEVVEPTTKKEWVKPAMEIMEISNNGSSQMDSVESSGS